MRRSSGSTWTGSATTFAATLTRQGSPRTSTAPISAAYPARRRSSSTGVATKAPTTSAHCPRRCAPRGRGRRSHGRRSHDHLPRRKHLMGAALGWGALSASSLVIGALLGLARQWPKRQVGMVLAFGAGALVAAVSFELVAEGAHVSSGGWVALGLALGALTYYFADGIVDRRGAGRHGGAAAAAGAGPALALGAFLDGIPEQAVLGISLAGSGGVSVGLLVAIF